MVGETVGVCVCVCRCVMWTVLCGYVWAVSVCELSNKGVHSDDLGISSI